MVCNWRRHNDIGLTSRKWRLKTAIRRMLRRHNRCRPLSLFRGCWYLDLLRDDPFPWILVPLLLYGSGRVSTAERQFLSRPSPTPGVRLRLSDPAVGVVPVTGVTNRLLTRAIRRVEARWRELYGPSTDAADIPRILAASALAADRGDPSFIDSLTPRPSLRLSLHLVDLLEDELISLARS